MAVFSEAKPFDIDQITYQKRGKTEIRKKMESLSVGLGFSVSAEPGEIDRLLKTARYAAQNISDHIGVYRVFWEKKGKTFLVVRTR